MPVGLFSQALVLRFSSSVADATERPRRPRPLHLQQRKRQRRIAVPILTLVLKHHLIPTG